MADGKSPGRPTVIAIVLGLLVLGGLVGAAGVLLVTDDDGNSASTTTPSGGSTTALAPTAPSREAEPACTNAALLAAMRASDPGIISVDGFQCGNGWAGTSYSNAEFSSAALLQAQSGIWVVVDRAQYCGDPSIPADVYTFCTVS